MSSRILRPLTLGDLETLDGKYNVGKLVDLEWPWVGRGEAQEVLDIANSHSDWLRDEIYERTDRIFIGIKPKE